MRQWWLLRRSSARNCATAEFGLVATPMRAATKNLTVCIENAAVLGKQTAPVENQGLAAI
jgi:hypothetical protein